MYRLFLLTLVLLASVTAAIASERENIVKGAKTHIVKQQGYVGEFSFLMSSKRAPGEYMLTNLTRLPLASLLEGNCDDTESCNDSANADDTCKGHGDVDEGETEQQEMDDGSKQCWGKCGDGNLWGRHCPNAMWNILQPDTFTDEPDPVGDQLPEVVIPQDKGIRPLCPIEGCD